MNFKQLTQKFAGQSLETNNKQYVRHNAYSKAGQNALELYDQAVGLMKQRSAENPGDPLGWYYQASIHGTFLNQNRQALASWAEANGYVDSATNVIDGNTVLNNCTHYLGLWSANSTQGWPDLVPPGDDIEVNFALWHRLYLQSFEDVVRTVLTTAGVTGASSWALPYWEYTKDDQAVIPELFRTETSSLYEFSRSVLINEGKNLSTIKTDSNGTSALESIQENLDTLLNLNSYQSMNSWLNSNPHGFMHDVIGGSFDATYGNAEQATANGQQLITTNQIQAAQAQIADALGVPNATGFNAGLMANVGAAALDPVFWSHHAYIDKILSDWNGSAKGNYATSSELANNPWNYQFFTPSTNNSNTPTTYSNWGDNPTGVISNVYNTNYAYDDLDTTGNPSTQNPVLALLELPAYRPIVSEQELNGERLAPREGFGTYWNTINPDFSLSLNNLIELLTETTNPIFYEANLDYKVKMNTSETITIFLGAVNQLTNATNKDQFNFLPSFNINPFPMGGDSSMLMRAAATIDTATILEQTLRNADDTQREQLEDYFSQYGSDEIGFLAYSESDDITLEKINFTLNQNLNSINEQGSNFDDAAYLAQNPELLSNPEALLDPQAYYNTHHTPQDIAPKLNFRAAAVGMRYLMSNPDLVSAGTNASPYDAIANYLEQGQANGNPLGDADDLIATSWLNANNDPEHPIFDFRTLLAGETITADVIIGRDAAYQPIVGFYSVQDLSGSVQASNGTLLSPGDAGYAEAALSQSNQFSPLNNLNANQGIAESRTVSFDNTSGLLAPYATVQGNIFFAFAEANQDGVNHFLNLGKNLIGLEDIYGGGDQDYDDTLIGMNFQGGGVVS